MLIFCLALALNEHGLKMPILTTIFSAHNFLSVNILSNVTAAHLFFCMTHSSWRSLSNGYMFLYSRTMFSDKQSKHICSQASNQLGTQGGAKSFLRGAQIF